MMSTIIAPLWLNRILKSDILKSNRDLIHISKVNIDQVQTLAMEETPMEDVYVDGGRRQAAKDP